MVGRGAVRQLVGRQQAPGNQLRAKGNMVAPKLERREWPGRRQHQWIVFYVIAAKTAVEEKQSLLKLRSIGGKGHYLS
jgi:hypothetical protein